MASLGTSGCAPLWRATPLSPVGQSEGSRAEDAGCPLLAGGEPGWGLWWCLASSPTELVTSAGVETSLCTTSRRAQQCQARGPGP